MTGWVPSHLQHLDTYTTRQSGATSITSLVSDIVLPRVLVSHYETLGRTLLVTHCVSPGSALDCICRRYRAVIVVGKAVGEDGQVDEHRLLHGLCRGANGRVVNVQFTSGRYGWLPLKSSAACFTGAARKNDCAYAESMRSTIPAPPGPRWVARCPSKSQRPHLHNLSEHEIQ